MANLEFSYKTLYELILKKSDDTISGNKLIDRIAEFEDKKHALDKYETNYSFSKYDEFSNTDRWNEFINLIIDNFKLAYFKVNRLIYNGDLTMKVKASQSNKNLISSDRSNLQHNLYTLLIETVNLVKKLDIANSTSIVSKVETLSIIVNDNDFLIITENSVILNYNKILKALNDKLNDKINDISESLVSSNDLLVEDFNITSSKFKTVKEKIEEKIEFTSNNQSIDINDQLNLIRKEVFNQKEIFRNYVNDSNRKHETLKNDFSKKFIAQKNDFSKKFKAQKNDYDIKLAAQKNKFNSEIKHLSNQIKGLTNINNKNNDCIKDLIFWKTLCNGREILYKIMNTIDDKSELFSFVCSFTTQYSNQIHSDNLKCQIECKEDLIGDAEKYLITYSKNSMTKYHKLLSSFKKQVNLVVEESTLI